MSKVHFLKLLCHNRHILYGSAYLDDGQTDPEVVKESCRTMQAVMGVSGDVCGLCGPTAASWADEETEFESLQAAAGAISEMMATIEREKREVAKQRKLDFLMRGRSLN